MIINPIRNDNELKAAFQQGKWFFKPNPTHPKPTKWKYWSP